MKSSKFSRSHSRIAEAKSRKQGFALIVTVTMLILLSLIAVGLLSLSTVTLRASNSLSAQLEAQANAKLALSLAIAQLQRELGPDQRVSAVADIAGDNAGDQLSAGSDPQNGSSLDSTNKGLTSVQPGTRYWTGAFENNDTPDQIFEKTPSASHRSWLVSHLDQESQQSLATPASASFVANNDGTPAQGDAGIVLVGRNSFGNEGSTADNYVVAPIINLTDEESVTGSLAWWIGDENVKAVINGAIQSPSQNEQNLATLSPQRLGWEVVNGLEDYPTPNTGDQASLERITTLKTAELLLGQSPSLLTDNESLFHSATTAGQGLHVNVSDGGLKVDLTAALANGLASSNSDLDNYPEGSNPIIRPLATRDPLDLLTWERLLPFYQRTQNTSTSNTLQVGIEHSALGGRSRTSTGGAYTIAPVVVDLRLLLGARVTTAGGRSRDIVANPCAKIAIVIANPYSRTLEWSDELEFQFRNLLGLRNNQSARIWNFRNGTAYFPHDESAVDGVLGTEAAVFNQAVFQIAPGNLAPGEARVYTMASLVSRPSSAATSRIDVPLVADADSLGDFTSCLEMEVSTPRNIATSLDVRESNNTTTIQLEMRVGGESLQRLTGFELNNSDFRATQKTWSTPIPDPVPLQLYSFQLSQPGIDYSQKFTSTFISGLRASALRTYADFNLQAYHFDSPITSYTPPPYFFENNDSASQIGGTPSTRTAGQSGSAFQAGLFDNPLPWGFSDTEGSARTVLYSIPNALSSLAQFQHLDLTVDDTKLSVAHQPAYAVGNSYATPFVRREVTEQARFDYVVTGFGNSSSSPRNYYDITYLLNASLWDRYFFSTWDSSQSNFLNPNQVSIADVNSDFSDPNSVAASVVNSKMFNVNSTSISAWKAFLASSRDHISIGGSTNKISFPRSLQQPEPAVDNPTGSEQDSLAGNRVISDQEVDSLAREIVRQVRLRGPFLSMSHFVNRSLADAAAERELTRSGPLQFALDESGINMDIDGNNFPFSEIVPTSNRAAFAFDGGSTPRAERPDGSTDRRPNSRGEDEDWAASALDRNYKSLSSIVADRSLVGGRGRATLSDEFGYRATSIPAWVNQADVLQLLGPSMSVRSDSFTIRTCGRSHDASGNVVAVAYAEALVQRVPEFIDPTNEPTDNLSQLSSLNQQFGRRFQLVSFRWLSENEI